MDTYNTGKMKNCASQIEAELATYKTSKEAIDTIVTNLRGSMESPTNEAYTSKYNKEAKPAAESIMNLMKTYATLLTDAANEIEKIEKTGTQKAG